jgi:hypothetical protein
MHEGDLLDWLSVAAVAVAALAAARYGLRVPARRGRFMLLAASLAFLAVDDAFGLHERVTATAAADLGVSGRGDVLFLVPYLPLLVGVFAILWMTAREGRDLGGRVIWVGIGLLVGGLCLRVLRALASTSGVEVAGWQRTLGNTAMHDAELLAWVAVAAGLVLVQTARTSARTPRAASDAAISST